MHVNCNKSKLIKAIFVKMSSRLINQINKHAYKENMQK